MGSTITIQTRCLGQRKPLLADWSIPFPPDLLDGGDPLTLRDLITRIVLAEVEAFRTRQSEQRFLRVLTRQEIGEGVAKGRVVSGQREIPPQPVDEQHAVATALQAFEDGLYLVTVDGRQESQLDREVHVRSDSRVTFIRLTMLAGGF